MSTDTIPGFHCRIDKPEAIRRIRKIKGRSDDKPFLILAESVVACEKLVGELNDKARQLLSSCWPGPFTFILSCNNNLDENINSGLSTVAIRVPDNKELLSILAEIDSPLVSTSANRAGDNPLMFEEAVNEFSSEIDHVFTGISIDSYTSGSAIVDLTVWPPELIREGPQTLPVLAD
ncbi:MAG: threonylcarbamoyl-AMP synthase [bacterium]|nr:threonylcarbamoyl-AMP synthase [bacterium]